MFLPSGPRPFIRRLFAGSLVVLQLSVAGCAAIGGRPAPIDRSADPGIVSALQDRLAAEPALDASLFRIESRGGVLLLYGTVHGLGQWNCALRNALLVDGVVTVVDYLTIERGPRESECGAPRGSD